MFCTISVVASVAVAATVATFVADAAFFLLGGRAELGHASPVQPAERELVQWLKSVPLGHREGWHLRGLRCLGWWFSSLVEPS